jgi:hypothetical protein
VVQRITPPAASSPVAVVSTPKPSAGESTDSVPGMDCSDISVFCSMDSETPASVNSDSEATILTSYAAEQNG